jgi:hypothetical protein
MMLAWQSHGHVGTPPGSGDCPKGLSMFTGPTIEAKGLTSLGSTRSRHSTVGMATAR